MKTFGVLGIQLAVDRPLSVVERKQKGGIALKLLVTEPRSVSYFKEDNNNETEAS
jgi:hypothetical protein